MIGRHRAPVAVPSSIGLPNPCLACKRHGTVLETRPLDGVGSEPGRMCVDAVDCRQHWPAEDRRGVR